MNTLTTIAALREALDEHRSQGRSIGLVPTMGYLHRGHSSLIERAAQECDVVVTTVFVNPLQFAAGEDLDTYPRDPEGDALAAERAGATLLFLPSSEEMYPGGRDAVLTSVQVDELSRVMEGASRPTHFSGMCTVVAKLFNIVGPCRAYFGDKDFQQLAIVRRMVADLSIPVEVLGRPTVREDDGLAMSSRNVRLRPDERAVATVLLRALEAGQRAVRAGVAPADEVREQMAAVIRSEPLAELDYLEVADPDTLVPVETIDAPVRLFGAVRFSAARLIDNLAADPAHTDDPAPADESAP
ncbi:MAG: pantoate--beta-alanine ligase [Microthrixaceae bacterium]